MAAKDKHLEIWIGDRGPFFTEKGTRYPREPLVSCEAFRFKIIDTGKYFGMAVDPDSNELIVTIPLEAFENVEGEPQDEELLQYDDGSGNWVGVSLADLGVLIKGGTLVAGNLVEANADEEIVDAGVALTNLAQWAASPPIQARMLRMASGKLTGTAYRYDEVPAYVTQSGSAPGAAIGTVTLDISGYGKFEIPYITKT